MTDYLEQMLEMEEDEEQTPSVLGAQRLPAVPALEERSPNVAEEEARDPWQPSLPTQLEQQEKAVRAALRREEEREEEQTRRNLPAGEESAGLRLRLQADALQQARSRISAGQAAQRAGVAQSGVPLTKQSDLPVRMDVGQVDRAFERDARRYDNRFTLQ